MSSQRLDFVAVIGRNRYGYVFGVGRWGSRWVGFARARGVCGGPGLLCVFPEVCEGFDLGVSDRALAVRLTCAVALDPESGYGGVDEWSIGPAQRGRPEDFRCGVCGTLHLPGFCEGALEFVLDDGGDGP